MILLILFIIIFFDFGFRLFKFHYDSINSRKEFADKAEIGVFKFHYDSINSTTGTIYRKLAFIDLNSIMILLIRDKMRRRVMTIANLNSIMILLIRSSNHSMPIYPNSFKFHYDSINSYIYKYHFCFILI